MNFDNAIQKLMSKVKSGSDEPLIFFRTSEGEWQCDAIQNQHGETFDWVADVKEKDPLALTIKGSDFSKGSFPYVYDKILSSRIRAEYELEYKTDIDSEEYNALVNLFEDNAGDFDGEVTEYLTTLERPLAALYEMCPVSIVSRSDDYYYDEELADEVIEKIENEVFDRLHSYPAEPPKKRSIEGYTESLSIDIASKTVIFAENSSFEMPYLVCNIKYDNPFLGEEYYNGEITDNYVEAMRVFAKRVDSFAAEHETEREKRGLPFKALTAADCVPNGLDDDIEGKLIIINPEKLSPEYRSADYQLQVCTGGNGARPNARGNAVFCTDLYSGGKSRYERYHVLGVADIERLPDWAKEKYTALNSAEKKPSLHDKITAGKEKAERSKSKNEKESSFNKDKNNNAEI